MEKGNVISGSPLKHITIGGVKDTGQDYVKGLEWMAFKLYEGLYSRLEMGDGKFIRVSCPIRGRHGSFFRRVVSCLP